jgi:hypothetical protein
MTDRREIARAYSRLAAIKGFYIHFAAFALVCAALLAINAASGGGWWVQWVVLGWGIGIVAHALAVFSWKPAFIGAWEQRKVRQLLDR